MSFKSKMFGKLFLNPFNDSLNMDEYIERRLQLDEYHNWGLKYSTFRIELEVKIHQRQGWELVENLSPTKRHLRINHNNFNIKDFDPRDGLLHIGNEVDGKKEGIHIVYNNMMGDIEWSFEYKDGLKQNKGYEF